MTRSRGNQGVVLVVVIFFALLLTSSIATFLKRSTVDFMISRHREDAAQAEAVAKGGVQIAIALVLDDKLQKLEGLPIHTGRERWAIAKDNEIEIGPGAVLNLHIEDTGSKLNLNAFYDRQEGSEPGSLDEDAVPFFAELLAKAIGEMGATPEEEALYDAQDLAENLADYLDANDVRQHGGREDDFYGRQDPPYAARNAPLLSIDELRLIEGFDAALVTALGDYVTVYPYVGLGGINPNTAPPHVLALLFAGDGGSRKELANEDTVRQIIEVRDDEGVLCPDEINHEECTPIREIVANSIFPPPRYDSNAFLVHSKATVGEIERTLEAVIDITQPATPLLLSWQMR